MMVCRLRLAEEHMTYLKPPRDDGCSAADTLADFYFVSHKGVLQGSAIGGGAEALGPVLRTRCGPPGTGAGLALNCHRNWRNGARL